MTLIAPVSAPTAFRLWPAKMHRHKWALLIDQATSREFPHDSEDVIFAVCTEKDCGERLTKEQIEWKLDQMESEW
jgi:hypothetical protein